MIVYRTRTCTKCGEVLILTSNNFHFSKEPDGCGMISQCKECRSKKQKETYNPEHYEEYYKKNKNNILEYHRDHYLKNKKKIAEYNKNNKKRRNTRDKKRREKDPIFKFTNNVRRTIAKSVDKKSFSKNTEMILGCDFEFFKEYIEARFSEGMNWNNQGQTIKGKWQLHHLIPLHTAEDEEELILLNHYTNFYPLWTEDHLETHKHLSRCGL